MKPKFLEAIKYILNGEEGFKAFIKNPRVELTNNGAERDFRKWVVNRTRSRFYVSTRGAEAASKLYSLMMTAKNNGYNVYSYFDYLFDKIRYEDLNNKETLKKYLPYKKQIPEYCKMQTVKEIRTRIKALEDNQQPDYLPVLLLYMTTASFCGYKLEDNRSMFNEIKSMKDVRKKLYEDLENIICALDIYQNFLKKLSLILF